MDRISPVCGSNSTVKVSSPRHDGDLFFGQALPYPGAAPSVCCAAPIIAAINDHTPSRARMVEAHRAGIALCNQLTIA